jgi:hypothetical protein
VSRREKCGEDNEERDGPGGLDLAGDAGNGVPAYGVALELGSFPTALCHDNRWVRCHVCATGYEEMDGRIGENPMCDVTTTGGCRAHARE